MGQSFVATLERVEAAAPHGGPRDRLLEGALRVFSEQGFRAASVREITDLVGVNIAAVNYYFGSKDGLIRSVLHRYVAPIVEARKEALDGLEAQAKTLALKDVVRCLVVPMVTMSRDKWGGRSVVMLLLQTRVCPTPEIQSIVTELFNEITHRFIGSLLRAEPGLGREKAYWRYNFALGAIMQVLADTRPSSRRLELLSDGLCKSEDKIIIEELVDFICDGARCGAPDKSSKGRRKS